MLITEKLKYKVNSIKEFDKHKRIILTKGKEEFHKINPKIWAQINKEDLLEKLEATNKGYVNYISYVKKLRYWIHLVPKKDLGEVFSEEFLKEKTKPKIIHPARTEYGVSGDCVLTEVIRSDCLDKIDINNITLESLIIDDGTQIIRTPLDYIEAKINLKIGKLKLKKSLKGILGKILKIRNLSTLNKRNGLAIVEDKIIHRALKYIEEDNNRKC